MKTKWASLLEHMYAQQERDSSKARCNQTSLKHWSVFNRVPYTPLIWKNDKNKGVELHGSYFFYMPKIFYGLLRRRTLQSNVWDSFGKGKWRTTMIITSLILPDVNEFWEQRSNKQYLCLYADIHKKAKWWCSSKFCVPCKLAQLWLQWNTVHTRLCFQYIMHHFQMVVIFHAEITELWRLWRFLPLTLVETKSNPV